MHSLHTARLRLRRLTLDDAEFIVALVNEPAWLQFIGDKGVRNAEDARAYLRRSVFAMYERHGFGLLAVTLPDGTPIGICGLLQRETLPDVDLGYALLATYRGHGYAREAALGVRDYAVGTLGLRRLVALTAFDNVPSIRLLELLGFGYEDTIELPNLPPSKRFGYAAPIAARADAPVGT